MTTECQPFLSARVGAALFLAALCSAVPARADEDLDDDSINLHHAYAPIDGAGLTAVDGGRTLDQFDVHAGLTTSYIENPLELGLSGDRRTRGVLFQMTVLDFVASVGLLDGLSLGVALPVVVAADGRDDLATGSDVRGSGLGQARVQLKWTAWDGEHLSLALAPYLTLPTGRQQDYLSDNGNVGGGAFAAATVRFSRFRIHGQLGYEDVSSDAGLGDLQVPARIRFGFGVEVVLLRGRAQEHGVHRRRARHDDRRGDDRREKRSPRETGEDRGDEVRGDEDRGDEDRGDEDRGDEDRGDEDRDGELLGGSTISLAGEVFGWTTTSRPFHAERERPIEFLGSLRWRHPVGLSAAAAVGGALNNGIGAPDWRGVLTLSFDF